MIDGFGLASAERLTSLEHPSLGSAVQRRVVSAARPVAPLQMSTCSFHNCLHALNQRLRIERLGKERLKPRVECPLSMRRIDMRADGNGGRVSTLVRGKGADAANELASVLVWQ
jgi:hypothetical protein